MTAYKIGKCKSTTISGYNSILDRYLYPALGDLPVDKFDPRHIQAFLNDHKNAAEKYLREMKTLLNDAGADVMTIQGILGQKDYKAAMERYVHPVEKRKHEAVEKVGNMLSCAG